MSMATPFQPEPEPDPETGTDDVLPVDDRLDDAESTSTDDDELQAALHAHQPKGLPTPVAGAGLTSDELRSDLAE